MTRFNAISKNPTLNLRPFHNMLGQHIELNTRGDASEASKDLCRDILWALYDPSPSLIEQPTLDRELSLRAMQWFLDSDEFKRARTFTVNSVSQASYMTTEIYEMLKEQGIVDIIDDFDASEDGEDANDDSEDGEDANDDSEDGEDANDDSEDGEDANDDSEDGEDANDDSEDGDSEGDDSEGDDSDDSDSEGDDSDDSGDSEGDDSDSGDSEGDDSDSGDSEGDDSDDSDSGDSEGDDSDDSDSGDDCDSEGGESDSESGDSDSESALSASMAKMDEALEGGAKDVLKSSVSQFLEETGEAAAVGEGWGVGAGSDGAIDRSDVESISYALARYPRMFDFVGRARGIAISTYAQIETGGGQLSEAGLTKKLNKISNASLMRLHNSHPERGKAIEALQTTGLMGKVYRSNAEQEGDFEIFVDTSGSMGGTPHVVAKGIAVGMSLAAKDQGRKFYLTSYSSDFSDVLHADHESPLADIADWMIRFKGGGTDVNKPLIRFLNRVETDRPQGIDLVIITDGDDDISNREITFNLDRHSQVTANPFQLFGEMRERLGIRLHLVLIDHDDRYGQNMKELADTVIRVDDISGDADEIVRQVTEGVIEGRKDAARRPR